MRPRRRMNLICLLVTACHLIMAMGHAGELTAPAVDVQLRIDGAVETPLTFSAQDLAALPRQTLQVRDHDGRETVFEGVTLVELLKRAGVQLGRELRGAQLLTYVVIGSTDGYRVVFALAEIDPAFNERSILLADRRDQQLLSPAEGPLRLVVPGEKRHARWVRQVTSVAVRRAD